MPPSQSSLLQPRYKSTHDATLQAVLVDGGLLGGPLSFKDPWQINLYHEPSGYRNRGFNDAVDTLVSYNQSNLGLNTNFKGVFLNQSGPPFWNPPYYSVGAPNPQTINGIESFFLRWNNSLPTQVEFRYPDLQETPVVFKQSGAMATAIYKAKSLSSLPTATASASQRKLAAAGSSSQGGESSNEKLVKVYASGGEIWESRSNDNGLNWTNEVRISDGAGGYDAPSIATELGDQNDEGIVVYRRQVGSNYHIIARPGNGTTPFLVNQGLPVPLADDPRPVIARFDEGGRKLRVLWNHEGGIRMRDAVWNGAWTWGGISWYSLPSGNPGSRKAKFVECC